ncbi:MAG: hypothetical protein H0X14_10075 [Acidobacteria bacterium]|nr:hypothetical protein [Acidobacteriota bacterium]
MDEHRDDTTDGGVPSRTERPSGKYYYDDATGYEVYDPSKDHEDDDREDDDEAKEEAQAGKRGVSGVGPVTTPFSLAARWRARLACAGEWFAA